MSKTVWSRVGARFERLAPVAGLAALVVIGVSTHAMAGPTSPEGIWYTDKDESIIRVHSCADTPDAYCGTIVWLKEPTDANGTVKIDKLNKDVAKKNRPLLGLDIFVDMKSDDDHWRGKAYNPEDGKFYDITFKVKTDKEENDQADLRGCLGSGMLTRYMCQTQTFNRAKEVPGGDPTLTADAGAPIPTKKHKIKKDVKKDLAAH